MQKGQPLRASFIAVSIIIVPLYTLIFRCLGADAFPYLPERPDTWNVQLLGHAVVGLLASITIFVLSMHLKDGRWTVKFAIIFNVLLSLSFLIATYLLWGEHY